MSGAEGIYAAIPQKQVFIGSTEGKAPQGEKPGPTCTRRGRRKGRCPDQSCSMMIPFEETLAL